MKRSILARLCMSIVFLLACFSARDARCITTKETGEQKALDPKVQGAVDELLTTEDYQVLLTLPRQWTSNLSETAQKDLIIELLKRIGTRKELKLENYGDMIVKSRVHTGEMKSNERGVLLKQDIFIEGGRCAWALERLLNCDMPMITTRFKLEHTERAIQLCTYKVIQAMRLPGMIDLKKLDVKERRRLAALGDTAAHLFAELARDPEPEVRKALAKNLKASLRIIQQLRKYDPDEEVRKLASKNLEHARRIGE